jgi:hypothetical protein
VALKKRHHGLRGEGRKFFHLLRSQDVARFRAAVLERIFGRVFDRARAKQHKIRQLIEIMIEAEATKEQRGGVE